MADERIFHAPGRVNLIGDHTDYTGGLVFPMAIDRGTTVRCRPRAGAVSLVSDQTDGRVEITLPFTGTAAAVEPSWGTYIAAMAAELGVGDGVEGEVTSDIPAGAGLSSSAALECAVALALGFEGSPVELAQLARRAEHAATGVPTGIMDQLCIAAATEGHATMIDCSTNSVDQVAVPEAIDVVVQFVEHRTLVGSGYADRVAECATAEAAIGPLRRATPADAERVPDPVARKRARHVTSENQRVRDFAAALAADDFPAAGRLMVESHRSLRDDFENSTAAMDAAVDDFAGRPGVYGARMTGGGFGGCIVAITEPGALDAGWHVRASAGARELS